MLPAEEGERKRVPSLQHADYGDLMMLLGATVIYGAFDPLGHPMILTVAGLVRARIRPG
jgi:hypothetical protein